MQPCIHLFVLASGSKGNAAIVEGPEGGVLVDCGISFRELVRRAHLVGYDLGCLCAVLVTHEHADHVSGLPVLSRRLDVGLYATAGTAGGRKSLAEVPFSLVRHDETLALAGMRVQLFPTSHDVADPFGVRFSVLDADGTVMDAVGWCTDTGMLTAEALGALQGTRILGLEANHDVGMLAHGPYPPFLRERVGGEHGHLSNRQCAEALSLLVDDETESIVALHVSQRNNTPGTCIHTLADALGANAVEPDDGALAEARTGNGRLSVCVASQDAPLAVW